MCNRTIKQPEFYTARRNDRREMLKIKYLVYRIYYCDLPSAVLYYILYFYVQRREVKRMTYNYNRLWKLLIDKRMTKTEMRKAAGISTNILAKMGKDEPVAMDTLAKIATALQCGLDDIVEIQNDAEKGGAE